MAQIFGSGIADVKANWHIDVDFTLAQSLPKFTIYRSGLPYAVLGYLGLETGPSSPALVGGNAKIAAS
jgi:hypothetical protein